MDYHLCAIHWQLLNNLRYHTLFVCPKLLATVVYQLVHEMSFVRCFPVYIGGSRTALGLSKAGLERYIIITMVLYKVMALKCSS